MRNYISGYYPGIKFQPVNDPVKFFSIVGDYVNKGVTSTDKKYNIIFGSLVAGFAQSADLPDTFVSFVNALLQTTQLCQPGLVNPFLQWLQSNIGLRNNPNETYPGLG